MVDTGRMGKRIKISDNVTFRLPSGGPYRLEGRDVSHNAITVTVPLESDALDNMRIFFSEIATIDHPVLAVVAEGKLYRVQKLPGDLLKWTFTFIRKQKLRPGRG